MRRNSAFSISVVSVCLFAPSLHAQDDNARRLSELARNAAQQFASARAEVGPDAPGGGHRDAGAQRRAVARRGHDPRARTQPRHRGRAAESAAAGIQPDSAARHLPARRQFDDRSARGGAAADEPVERRQHRPERHVDLQRWHVAVPALGRRRGGVPVQQRQAGHVEHLRQLQPDVHGQLRGHVHTAADARLHDRPDAPADQGDHHQPRHLRNPTPGHARHDGRQRSQRILGAAVLRASRGRRERLAGTGRQAGRGQPGARGSGHDGPPGRGGGRSRSRRTAGRRWRWPKPRCRRPKSF